MRKIKGYFGGVAEEARRVRWPRKKDFWNSVAIVMSVTVVAALVILLLDFLTVNILRGFENNFEDEATTSSAAAMLLNMFKGRF